MKPRHSRYVFGPFRGFLNWVLQHFQRVADGLQIRAGGFDSPTCLQYLADPARYALNKVLNIHVPGAFCSGLLALCLMALPATAGTPLDPPAQYDHPYAGELTVHMVERSNVWRECSENGRYKVRRDAAGCAIFAPGRCTVYLATKTRRAPLDAILRHEIAHCNGWSHE